MVCESTIVGWSKKLSMSMKIVQNLITRASFARAFAYLRGSFRQLVRGTSPDYHTWAF